MPDNLENEASSKKHKKPTPARKQKATAKTRNDEEQRTTGAR
jgi:hypothetical protein